MCWRVGDDSLSLLGDMKNSDIYQALIYEFMNVFDERIMVIFHRIS